MYDIYIYIYIYIYILYIYIGTSFSLHIHQRYWDACAYTCDVLKRFVTPQSVVLYMCRVYTVPGTFPVLLDMHACVLSLLTVTGNLHTLHGL